MAPTPTTGLADAMLPLIRTRSDLHRWSASNAHGRDMHEAIDILEQDTAAGPAERYAVTHKALTSAIKVIARADDSSGIIGDACIRLLNLHPRAAAAAQVKPSKLIDWMMAFQFGDNPVDYFELDIVAYADALGEQGVAAYRSRLAEIEASLGPRPNSEDRWQSANSGAWFTLDWNAKRLAILDRDIDAIVRTHVGDRKVAAWFHQTAEAFEEIGEYDLAIDWARQATQFNLGHQSVKASRYWAKLIDEHRPADSLDTRAFIFRRWPNSGTATELFRASGTAWPSYHDEVLQALSRQPYDAVIFTLNTLHDPRAAWDLAHDLSLDSDRGWATLIDEYERIDALAVIPIHERLVRTELSNTGAEHYRRAGRRLARMRKLVDGTARAAHVDSLIADLREEHRRRPRLQQEFTKAGLP